MVKLQRSTIAFALLAATLSLPTTQFLLNKLGNKQSRTIQITKSENRRPTWRGWRTE